VTQDLPIDLPQLAGAHTGDAIAATISKTLKTYGITLAKLGYFVLDNAANNNTAITALSLEYNFNPTHRRLRCGPHTLNLVGQAIIFGDCRITGISRCTGCLTMRDDARRCATMPNDAQQPT
jgi:hypothetical protein